MNFKSKRQHRITRHKRIRARIYGTAGRPRISVFKSNKNIFVQFIDDESGKTILSSKVVPGAKNKIQGTKTQKSEKVGEMLADKAKEIGIKEAVFDRGGSKYQGRIRAVAEGLRKGGIKF